MGLSDWCTVNYILPCYKEKVENTAMFIVNQSSQKEWIQKFEEKFLVELFLVCLRMGKYSIPLLSVYKLSMQNIILMYTCQVICNNFIFLS